jgi:hypothetical protein
MRRVVLYTLYWLYCSLQRAANIQYAWLDACLRRVVPVSGRRQQRAFFISTQLCFDLMLGFACTPSSRNTPKVHTHSAQTSWIKSSTSSSLLGM